MNEYRDDFLNACVETAKYWSSSATNDLSTKERIDGAITDVLDILDGNNENYNIGPVAVCPIIFDDEGNEQYDDNIVGTLSSSYMDLVSENDDNYIESTDDDNIIDVDSDSYFEEDID